MLPWVGDSCGMHQCWHALQLPYVDFACLQQQEGLSWLHLGEVAMPRSMLHARLGDCCKSAG